MEASTGKPWSELTTRLATSGITTHGRKLQIDTDLASATPVPTHILYNLGANDVPAMPSQATWESDTAYILDAMHVKWPAAKIYLTRCWRGGYATECNTLATWQDNVLATRSGWAFIGDDERVWMENGDNGATYTDGDMTHPNHIGYIRAAQQKQIAMGL